MPMRFTRGARPDAELTRTYYSPYQMHGSVGPSCAVANVTAAPDANGIRATVWSGTQGVYPLQQALAEILGLPQSADQGDRRRGRRLLRPQWR